MFEQAEKLFLIGGASGVGKSSLTEAITAQGLAVYKKIHSFAHDIAKDRKCELRVVFDKDFFVPEIISKMVAFTKQHRIVISDLHYAIQPKADTTFFLEGKANNDIFLTEEYKAAFTPKDLRSFMENHITLVPVLITCEVDQLVRRKTQIIGRSVKGGNDKKIAQKELSAELKFYESIVKGLDVGPYIFENSNQEPDDFHRKFIAFLEPQLKSPI